MEASRITPHPTMPGVSCVLLADGPEVSLVDTHDVPLIADRRWCRRPAQSTCYATSSKGDLHRLIINAPPGLDVDHKNGDGLDNRRCNIRLATPAQNAQNRKPMEGRRYKGVQPSGRGFAAMIDGEYIGSFLTEEDAARAYDLVAKDRWGEFARPNIPGATFFPVPAKHMVIEPEMTNEEDEGGATGYGIHCVECGADRWRVIDSRPAPGSIRRRRVCQCCGGRSTTYEMLYTPVDNAKSA